MVKVICRQCRYEFLIKEDTPVNLSCSQCSSQKVSFDAVVDAYPMRDDETDYFDPIIVRPGAVLNVLHHWGVPTGRIWKVNKTQVTTETKDAEGPPDTDDEKGFIDTRIPDEDPEKPPEGDPTRSSIDNFPKPKSKGKLARRR